MVNVSPQALAAAASPQTLAGHQLPALRLQLPTAAQTGTTNIPTTVSIQPPTSSTIRTQLGGNQIVLPATLAGGNAQVASIPANKVSQILPPTVTSQMITGSISMPTQAQITPMMQSPAPTQSSPSAAATTSSGQQHPSLRVHTTAANSQVNSAAPSQMSPTTAKMKCKNFLSTLIRLASEQPEIVATNVKTLIQGLIVCNLYMMNLY